jgi:hypothetical protein
MKIDQPTCTYRDLALERVVETINEAIGDKWWNVDPDLAHVIEDIETDLLKALNEDTILAKALSQPVRKGRESEDEGRLGGDWEPAAK